MSTPRGSDRGHAGEAEATGGAGAGAGMFTVPVSLFPRSPGLFFKLPSSPRSPSGATPPSPNKHHTFPRSDIATARGARTAGIATAGDQSTPGTASPSLPPPPPLHRKALTMPRSRNDRRHFSAWYRRSFYGGRPLSTCGALCHSPTASLPNKPPERGSGRMIYSPCPAQKSSEEEIDHPE